MQTEDVTEIDIVEDQCDIEEPAAEIAEYAEPVAEMPGQLVKLSPETCVIPVDFLLQITQRNQDTALEHQRHILQLESKVSRLEQELAAMRRAMQPRPARKLFGIF